MSATATATKASFTAKLSALKAGLRPALIVSNKGALKDHADTNRITVEFNGSDLLASAYGGRLAISSKINNMSEDGLNLEAEGEGKFTVNAQDFERSLNSFPESENVNIVLEGNEVIISKVGDDEEVQALPISVDDVTMPALAKSFEKEITIDKGVFLEGISQVLWATGDEDHKEQYHYWRLTAEKNSAKFAAGRGGRFKTWTVSGPGVVETDKTNIFFINRDQTGAIQTILGGIDRTHVVLQQASRKGDAPDQIVLEATKDGAGSFKLMLVGFDPNLKYPNIDKVIEEKRPYAVKTKVNDWEFATKGILATYNEEVKKDHDTHESDLEPKPDKKYILLTAKTGMRSQRKVPIEQVMPGTEKQDDGIGFHCSSTYIGEIFSKCPHEDIVEIQYDDASKGPVFVFGPGGVTDAAGRTIQYLLFFASLKA